MKFHKIFLIAWQFFLHYVKLKRFPTQNLDSLDRPALLKLYQSYAMPIARRGTNSTLNDVEMESVDRISHSQRQQNTSKRRNHQVIMAPSVDSVTSACKKIRLVNTNGSSHSINTNKRQIDAPMVGNISFEL